MKKVILAILLLAALHSNAQVTSKKIYVSGYGNFSHQSDLSVTRFELKPTLGYVVADNVVAGITLPLTYYHNASVYQSRTLGVGPMVRYYMGSSKFKVFPHVEVTYDFYKTTSFGSIVNFTNKEEQVSGFGAMGASYFVGKHAALELMAGYQIKDRIFFDYDTFKIQFGISVFFGGE